MGWSPVCTAALTRSHTAAGSLSCTPGSSQSLSAQTPASHLATLLLTEAVGAAPSWPLDQGALGPGGDGVTPPAPATAPSPPVTPGSPGTATFPLSDRHDQNRNCKQRHNQVRRLVMVWFLTHPTKLTQDNSHFHPLSGLMTEKRL